MQSLGLIDRCDGIPMTGLDGPPTVALGSAESQLVVQDTSKMQFLIRTRPGRVSSRYRIAVATRDYTIVRDIVSIKKRRAVSGS